MLSAKNAYAQLKNDNKAEGRFDIGAEKLSEIKKAYLSKEKTTRMCDIFAGIFAVLAVVCALLGYFSVLPLSPSFIGAALLLIFAAVLFAVGLVLHSKAVAILKENGLYEKRKDVFPLKSFQEDYLIEIGEFCHLPEDTCLTTYPEIIFNHEYIHKWCFDNFSEEYLAELHSKPVQQNWENDKQIQLIANKVSLRATEEPMEYIAEVGSGLAGGQKFDQDIMALYESLKGPKL